MATSDNIREPCLHAAKIIETANQDQDYHRSRDGQKRSRRLTLTQKRPTESFNDSGHRIQTIKRAPSAGYQRTRVRDRGSQKPELNQKTNRVTHVAIAHVERRQPQ